MKTLNAGDDQVKLVLHRKQKLYKFLKGKIKWILIKYDIMHSRIVKNLKTIQECENCLWYYLRNHKTLKKKNSMPRSNILIIAHNYMPRKKRLEGVSLHFLLSVPSLHIGRLRPSGCPATENLSLQFPCGRQGWLKGTVEGWWPCTGGSDHGRPLGPGWRGLAQHVALAHASSTPGPERQR